MLLAAHLLVAVQRKAAGFARIAQHHRAQEHHQVGLFTRAFFALEQVAEDRHVAQARSLVEQVLRVGAHQPGDHDQHREIARQQAVIDQCLRAQLLTATRLAATDGFG